MIVIDTDVLAQLNGSEIKLLLAIAKKVYEEKTNLITNKELLKLSGFSRGKMQYTRISLEEKGMISRGPNKGRGVQSVYEIKTLLVAPEDYFYH
ncbi:MAG: hypothetical protein AAFZ63_28130 [Bacteroidota bacterium]